MYKSRDYQSLYIMDQILKKIKVYLQVHTFIMPYIFWGVCTTLINAIAYSLLYECLKIENIISTIVAWILAVIFAFVTNKYFVFESKKVGIQKSLKEMVSFFGWRILTGVLDVIIMLMAVDKFHQNGIVWKVVSNILVTIINYIASKFLIFRGE